MTDPYQGSWSINLEKSRVWDLGAEKWISPDPIGREDLTFYIDGDIHDYTNTVGLDPTNHLAYTFQYGGGWVPYMCRKIEPSTRPEGSVRHPDMKMPFTPFKAGEPIAYIMLVKVNDEMHWRVSRSVDGKPQYAMVREMAPSGDAFTTTVIAHGMVTTVRVFERTSN